VGWRFSGEYVFSRSRLFSFLSGIEADRVKAVFVTDEGNYGFNMASKVLTETMIVACEESRIEIIADTINNDWENQLLLCRDS